MSLLAVSVFLGLEALTADSETRKSLRLCCPFLVPADFGLELVVGMPQHLFQFAGVMDSLSLLSLPCYWAFSRD